MGTPTRHVFKMASLVVTWMLCLNLCGAWRVRDLDQSFTQGRLITAPRLWLDVILMAGWLAKHLCLTTSRLWLHLHPAILCTRQCDYTWYVYIVTVRIFQRFVCTPTNDSVHMYVEHIQCDGADNTLYICMYMYSSALLTSWQVKSALLVGELEHKRVVQALQEDLKKEKVACIQCLIKYTVKCKYGRRAEIQL